jgi:hypothetical protein
MIVRVRRHPFVPSLIALAAIERRLDCNQMFWIIYINCLLFAALYARALGFEVDRLFAESDIIRLECTFEF